MRRELPDASRISAGVLNVGSLRGTRAPGRPAGALSTRRTPPDRRPSGGRSNSPTTVRRPRAAPAGPDQRHPRPAHRGAHDAALGFYRLRSRDAAHRTGDLRVVCRGVVEGAGEFAGGLNAIRHQPDTQGGTTPAKIGTRSAGSPESIRGCDLAGPDPWGERQWAAFAGLPRDDVPRDGQERMARKRRCSSCPMHSPELRLTRTVEYGTRTSR